MATPIRLEAENFNLEDSLFGLETNGVASGDAIISLSGQAQDSRGKVQTILDDLDGTYDVYIGYYDDSQGKGHIGVKLDGEKLDYWVLNKQDSEDAPENNFYRRKLRYGSDITISPGQSLEITGVKKDSEDVRIDYIEFVPTGETANQIQAGELALAESSYSLVEGDTASQQIMVTRTGGSDGAISATLQFNTGSATAEDFATSDITVNFAEGETSKTITLPIFDDAIAESEETFSISLVNPTGGATLGSQSQAEVTIQDNDIRLEAEHLTLDKFAIETSDFSSENALISLQGSDINTRGKAQTTLDLNGTYDVFIGYYDDSQGKGHIGVKLDGEKLDYWVLNKTDSEDAPENNFYRRKLRYGSDITISPGQTLEVTGLKKDSEDVRIDYIEFIAKVDNSSTTPSLEAGELAFGASTYSISEDGTTTQQVTVIRTNGSEGDVSATVQLEGGTATAADYAVETLTVSLDAGETSKTITLPIVDDALVEEEENFSISLINPTGGATIGSQNQAAVAIVDNEQPGQLVFSSAAYSFDENGGSANQVTIVRTDGSDGDISATVQFATGTATTADYLPESITVNFAAGETSQTLTLPIIDDAEVEGAESFNISLTNPTGGATIGSQNQANIAIVDDEKAGALAFGSATYILSEGDAANNQVTLVREGGSDGNVSATIQFNADTATTADYSPNPITVSFTPGETSKTITLPIIDDSEVEGEESFSLNLSNPTGSATLGNQSQTTITIADNDTVAPPPPADVLVVVEAESLDLTGSDYVTTQLSGASGDSIISFEGGSSTGRGTVSTELNLNGVYDVVLGYYDQNDGAAQMSVTLGGERLRYWVLNRDLPGSSPDSSNFIERQLSSASVITPGTRLEIFGLEKDGDTAAVDYVKFVPVDLSTRPGRLEFSQANYMANEDGSDSAAVTINRIAGNGGTVTTTLSLSGETATAGSDFNGDPITVSFAPGEETKTVIIPLINDSISETAETLSLQLGAPSGGATLGDLTQAQFSIVDDEESLGTSLDISGNVNASNPSDRHSFDLNQTSDFSAILEGLNGDANLSLFDSAGALILSSSNGGNQTEQLSQTLAAGSYELLVEAAGSNTATDYDLVVSATADEAGQNRALEVSTATYLGGAAQDEASAIEISPRNELIVAGNFGTAQGTGQTLLGANSSSAGQIVRMSLSGREVLSVTHLGDDINDMDINRQTGTIAVVGDFGISVLNETADQVLWSQDLDTAENQRVAIANDGTVVTLSNKTVAVWNSDGTMRSQRTFTRTFVNDLAIDPDTNQIYVTGFDNKYNNVDRNPVQVAYINSFDLDLNQGWQTWGYDADILTDDVNGQGQNDMADTRGYRLTIGQDGELYFLGEVAGGNSVFRWNGKDRSTPTQVKYDAYNDPYNSKSPHQVYYARINTNNGEVKQGQLAFPRLSNGSANTFRVKDGSLAADENGNVYIGGRAFASIDQRGDNTIDGQSVGSYAGGDVGEPTALVVSNDFQQRRLWTTFGENGGQGDIQGFAVGQGRAAILGTVVQGTTITSGSSAINPNAFNAGTDSLSDVYLATWATDTSTGFASVQYGTNGADSLVGGSTADLLVGGLGADTLQGDTRLAGGGSSGGADTFAYDSASEGGDTILDFGANDQILVSAAGFGLSTGSSVVLASNSQSLGSNSGFIYNNGVLSFDADGAGNQAAQVLATLSGSPSLSAGQIQIGS